MEKKHALFFLTDSTSTYQEAKDDEGMRDA